MTLNKICIVLTLLNVNKSKHDFPPYKDTDKMSYISPDEGTQAAQCTGYLLICLAML